MVFADIILFYIVIIPIFQFTFTQQRKDVLMIISVDQLHLLTLNVGFAQHNGDWNWKNVRSPFARLYYVTEGEAKVCMGADCFTLTPHHLYFIPAFTEHSYVCNAPFSHYYIHIYEDQQNGTDILDEFSFPFEVNAGSIDLELIKRLAEINPFLKLPDSNPQVYDNYPTLISNIRLNRQSPLHDKIESRGILDILMSRFFRRAIPKEDVKDNRIHQTITYIRKHIDSTMDIDMLADMSCMSKDHFIRVFKRETGETPNAYITKRRLEKAELALITTDLPVKDIAKMLGYDDCSYFNRLFRKNAGVTPQQYRGQNN